MTLYYTTLDAVGKSNITGSTLAAWPIFNSPNIAVPTSLAASDFGSIVRSDGLKQTTYKGWPLYYYSLDRAAGDFTGNGVGGVWFVVTPANFPPAATQSTPPPSSTYEYGPGY